MITTFSSHEFNQDASSAEKAALKGPVFITDRGRPTHVLLNIEDYRRLSDTTADAGSIVDLLAMPEDGIPIDFNPPRLDLMARPVDLG
jgi:prevent-host-death family protein